MARVLKVGIIGASAESGWAKESHVPAVQKLTGLELVAVASGDQAKSNAAAQAFGAKKAYGNAKDLVQDPEVDLVTIAVKVPDHRELLLPALAAGKHVYCEWPLGRNLTEAEELSAAAAKAGVHAAIGLQARTSPAALKARDLITSSAIGRPLSARLYSGTVAFSPKITTADVYLENAENGATLISIHGGHAIDLAIELLGPLADVTALAATQHPEIEIRDTGKKQARSIPDHLLVLGHAASGPAFSLEVAGGRPPMDTPFRLEVTGESGTLALEGGAPRGFQSGRLRLTLDGKQHSLDEGEVSEMPDTAANVARLYAALRDDIGQSSWTVTDFKHAVHLTKLCGDLLSSSRTGKRVVSVDWPGQKN